MRPVSLTDGLEPGVRIPLRGGGFALVDAADVELVSRWNWRRIVIDGCEYAESTSWRRVRMHRVILGLGKGQVAGHRNLCGLDNRRHNLRIATRAGNASNSLVRSGTGLKGVYACKVGKRFYAKITVRGVAQSLGGFDTAEEAARAYDKEARNAFGEFARLNFPRAHERSAR